jgi:hypothetical protein
VRDIAKRFQSSPKSAEAHTPQKAVRSNHTTPERRHSVGDIAKRFQGSSKVETTAEAQHKLQKARTQERRNSLVALHIQQFGVGSSPTAPDDDFEGVAKRKECEEEVKGGQLSSPNDLLESRAGSSLTAAADDFEVVTKREECEDIKNDQLSSFDDVAESRAGSECESCVGVGGEAGGDAEHDVNAMLREEQRGTSDEYMQKARNRAGLAASMFQSAFETAREKSKPAMARLAVDSQRGSQGLRTAWSQTLTASKAVRDSAAQGWGETSKSPVVESAGTAVAYSATSTILALDRFGSFIGRSSNSVAKKAQDLPAKAQPVLDKARQTLTTKLSQSRPDGPVSRPNQQRVVNL